MALETKKERTDEATDVWETMLTRRLTDELDAFLRETDAETFLFDDETNAPRRIGQGGKRPRCKTLATVAASLAILAGGAAAVCVYLARPTSENGAEFRQIEDEPSLLAWGVESWNETPWARNVEEKLAFADVFGASSSSKSEDAATQELTRSGDEKNAIAEESSKSALESNEWFNAEGIADVAQVELLKYEPFVQAIVASLL